MIKSLFFRMRLVHWIGIVLLIVNALVFTENIIARVVQLVIAIVIFIHDFDENKNGVKVTKDIIAKLENMSLDKGIEFDGKFSSEYDRMVSLINDFMKKLQNSLDITNVVKGIDNQIKRLEQIERDIETIFEHSGQKADELSEGAKVIAHEAELNLEFSKPRVRGINRY